MTVLLAVFRRPEMLKALLCERSGEFMPDGDGVAQPYRERVLALSSVHESICAWGDADTRAWRSLGKVPNMSARAAKAVVRSLLASVVDPDFDAPTTATLEFCETPIDLRPLLCNPDGERRVLAELGEAIPSENSTDLPRWHWTHRHEIAALPLGFRRHFLWGLSLVSWQYVELMAAMFESLELADNSALSLAVARLAAVGRCESTLWWCDVLADVPTPKRARAVEMILAAGAAKQLPQPQSRVALVAGDWNAALHQLQGLSDG